MIPCHPSPGSRRIFLSLFYFFPGAHKMAGHSRMPPNKRSHAGPHRVVLHRAEELPKDYRSTLRSAFVDPRSHETFFPTDGDTGMGARAAARLAAFKDVAEAEAAEREAAYAASKKVGSYDASSAVAMRDHGSDVYRTQKETGKFVRSNAFITGLSKPRTDVGCPQAEEGSYLDAPAITVHSYKGEGQVATSFRKKEDKLDYQISQVWGHGKVGALPQAYGT